MKVNRTEGNPQKLEGEECFVRVSDPCPCGCSPKPFVLLADKTGGINLIFDTQGELLAFKGMVKSLSFEAGKMAKTDMRSMETQ